MFPIKDRPPREVTCAICKRLRMTEARAIGFSRSSRDEGVCDACLEAIARLVLTASRRELAAIWHIVPVPEPLAPPSPERVAAIRRTIYRPGTLEWNHTEGEFTRPLDDRHEFFVVTEHGSPEERLYIAAEALTALDDLAQSLLKVSPGDQAVSETRDTISHLARSRARSIFFDPGLLRPGVLGELRTLLFVG